MKKWFTQIFILMIMAWAGTSNAQTVIESFDFDGDLQGWTTNVISGTGDWEFAPNAIASRGLYAGMGTAVASETPANGGVRFDADFYTTMGVTTPTQPYPPYHAELISPVMDLSSVSGLVSLRFAQTFRPLGLAAGATFRSSFQISNDGGATWSEPVDCNETVQDNAQGAAIPNGFKVFPIENVAGSSQVQIKFTVGILFYYWAIDDVSLTLRTDPDARVNDNFYAIPHNAMTPASQVEPDYFMADVENIGGADAENVNLNISIQNGAGSQVYTADKSYGTIGIGEIRENEFIDGSYTPVADMVDTYEGTYTISADGNDENELNNTQTFTYEITSDLFAKERDAASATSNVTPADDNSYSYGCHYTCNGDGFMVTEAQFGLAFNAADRANANGQTLSIYLYSWDDVNGNGVSEESERVTKGVGFYTMTGQEEYRNDGFLSVPIESWNTTGKDLILQKDTSYIITVEYVEDGARPATMFMAANRAIDYSAMVFINDSLGLHQRHAGMLDVGVTGELGSVGFGRDIVPVVRMRISPAVSSDDIELPDNSLTLFPNPASNVMNVDVELEEVAERVTMVVLTQDGRRVFTDTHKNVQSGSFEYNVSNLPNGAYIMHMTIDGAYKAKTFTVAK